MRELSNSKGTNLFVVRNRHTEEVVGSYRAASPSEALYLMYVRSGYGQAVRLIDDRVVFDDEHVEGLCGGPEHWIVEPAV